jgi:ABC-type Fe3+ transport system substrate-binding protein
LALTSIAQELGENAASPIMVGLKRNAVQLLDSSWPCAMAAAEQAATPISVTVEIAALCLARQNGDIRVVVPVDAPGIEAEGFAVIAKSRDVNLAQEILAWCVGPTGQDIARRWNKVILGDAAIAAGSFVIDHARASLEQARLANRFFEAVPA